MTRGSIRLVPRPRHVTDLGDSWELTALTAVVADEGVVELARLVRTEIQRATGWELTSSDTVRNAIRIRLDPRLGSEAYRLRCAPGGVEIVGGDPAGAFYGWQTLRQLLPPEIYADAPVTGLRWIAPAVDIEDVPQFRWRGALLDVGRRFLPTTFLFRFIDLLAMHKLNVLHLHLTEDAGWRVQIQRYPRLTEIGSWRKQTVLGRADLKDPTRDRFDGIPHGGFYTRADIAEVVRYAASRFVTVVPEIDIPGHSQAAIAAYPELGCTGRQLETATTWGISTSILNAELSTVEFFKSVFAEVFELFPSRYVHIGGDECPKDEWIASTRMQDLISERGLANEDELQSWFIRQFSRFFAEHDKRLIGWDEILDGGLADGATVMSWRGSSGGISAARAGHDVVMTPCEFTYFDYYQSANHATEPLAMDFSLTLEKTYGFQPVPVDLRGTPAADRVLGSQFSLWGEYMTGETSAEYMAFPRACAFAEAVWSPAALRSWPDFLNRLPAHLRRLDAAMVNYRRPLPGELSTACATD